MPEFHIRQITPADFAAAAELVVASLWGVKESYYSKVHLAEMAGRFTAENFQKWFKNGVQVFVAVESDTESVVGIVSWQKDHLFHLFIAPAWQGQGVGKQLLSWAEAQQAQASGAWLWCNASLDSVDFYSKNGYLSVCANVLPKTDIPIQLMYKVV